MTPKRTETSCSIIVALGDVCQESDEHEAEGVMARVVAVVNPTGSRGSDERSVLVITDMMHRAGVQDRNTGQIMADFSE